MDVSMDYPCSNSLEDKKTTQQGECYRQAALGKSVPFTHCGKDGGPQKAEVKMVWLLEQKHHARVDVASFLFKGVVSLV